MRSITNISRYLALGLLALNAIPSARGEKSYASWTGQFDLTSPLADRGQFSNAVATDARGNVYITGRALNVSDTGQFFVAKFDALDGHLIWSNTVTSNFAAAGRDIAVDHNGDVVACGFINNGSTGGDFYYAKFNPANGNVLWSRTIDGGNSGGDEAIKIAFTSNNDVVIGGNAVSASHGNDFMIVRASAGTGVPVSGFPILFNSIGGQATNDTFTTLAVDNQDNIIAGGFNTISGTTSLVIAKFTGNGSQTFVRFRTDAGGNGGITGLAVDSARNIYFTAPFTDGNNAHRGYYTSSLDANGNGRWLKNVPPLDSDANCGPCGLALDSTGNVIVSGTYFQDGADQIFTIRYTNTGTEFGSRLDHGITGSSTNLAEKMIVDGAGNVIVTGESDNAKPNRDLYVVKYNPGLTETLFSASANGSFDSGNDSASGVTSDAAGNVVVTGSLTRLTNGGNGIREAVTIKYQRFLVAQGELLETDPLPLKAVYLAGGTPVVSTDGTIMARVVYTVGKVVQTAIMYQTPAGEKFFVGVAGEVAPDAVGIPSAFHFRSFSDPVMSPDGGYAFQAQITGPPSQAAALYTSFNSQPKLTLRQGTNQGLPAGLALVSILNVSMENNHLYALVRVSGPPATSILLLSVDFLNQSTVLYRSGTASFDLTPPSTVKVLNTLSPALFSPGDGRWTVGAIATARLVFNNGQTALYQNSDVPNSLSKLAATGEEIPTSVNGPGHSYRALGLPSITTTGFSAAYQAVLKAKPGSVTTLNDAGLIYQSGFSSPAFVAREDGSPAATAANNSIAGLKYAAFSDPLLAAQGIFGAAMMFEATFRATPGHPVTVHNNHAIMFGFAGNPDSFGKLARTGEVAALTDGSVPSTGPVWASLHHLALLGGSLPAPLFEGNLAGPGVTAANALGLWAVDSRGALRRVIRTGDHLGTLVVKNFALLTPTSRATSARRSFNDNGKVTMAVVFTNRTSALLTLQLP